MRKMLKTIRAQLFLYYSVMAILLFLTLTGVIYINVSRLLSRRSEDSLIQLVQALSNELDYQIRIMNETSIRVAYSNLVKERFENYRTIQGEVSNYRDQIALQDIFIAIMGPLRSVHQLNLYNFDGAVVGAGHRNYAKKVPAETRPWFAETIALGGDKYLSGPFIDNETETMAVALSRVYYDNNSTAVGIIETLQKYEVL
ncbi:MAG: cache domain-containing protein, partial [Spirochaetales bacterium]|nr:cache domain-containing protein [Spirochaetales bacterium]